MTFKENAKTAVAKVLSDLIQSDGIVNQGEINYLRQVFKSLKIHDSHLKTAGTLSLADAAEILRGCGDAEKRLLLYMIQQLSASDGEIAPTETLLVSALLLSIGVEVAEAQGLHARIVSIPGPGFDTRNTVVYVENGEHSQLHEVLGRQYDSLSHLLERQGWSFFYLPRVMEDLIQKQHTFKQMLTYLEPMLSEEQLQLIAHDLKTFNSSDLSKELFLNYLNAKGFNIERPAFLFKIDSLKPDRHQDFLMLDIADDPLNTLEAFLALNEHVMEIELKAPNKNFQKYLVSLTMPREAHGPDAFEYTGFHKIIIDTLLKYHSEQGISRLRISSDGHLFLVDRNDAEIKIHTLGRALYILYLRHEEGIALAELADYREELMDLYAMISDYGNENRLRQTVDNLVNYVGNTMNPLFSRIKKSFTALLGEQAKDYLIEGPVGEKKKIQLDRKLVIDELH